LTNSQALAIHLQVPKPTDIRHRLTTENRTILRRRRPARRIINDDYFINVEPCFLTG
jgi:hypothetical protein